MSNPLSIVCMNHLPEKDLWTLPDNMLTASVSCEVENNFYSRCEPEKRPPFIQERFESASRSLSHALIQKEKDIDSERAAPRPDTKKSPKYDSSLFIALYKTFTTRIWLAGFLKVFSGAFLKFSHQANLIFVSRHAQDDHTLGHEGVLGVARRILCLLPPQRCGKGCWRGTQTSRHRLWNRAGNCTVHHARYGFVNFHNYHPDLTPR